MRLATWTPPSTDLLLAIDDLEPESRLCAGVLRQALVDAAHGDDEALVWLRSSGRVWASMLAPERDDLDALVDGVLARIGART